MTNNRLSSKNVLFFRLKPVLGLQIRMDLHLLGIS